MSGVPASRRASAWWWAALGAIVCAAVPARLCNLGTFSLGLDEGLTMSRAVMSFAGMIAACAADADNPPLYLVITYCSLRLGLVDPWLRLVPIAAGLASIVIWSWWVRRHFGNAASLLLAGFLALSTFHVRYSQELRAYPYLILLSGIAMLAGDRLRRSPGASSAALLAVVVGLGWYLHFSFALVVAPLVGLVLFGADRTVSPEPADRRRVAIWLVVALVAGTALFLPWFLHVRETLAGGLSMGANSWSLGLVAQRWQFLTVAAFEGESLDWLGMILAVMAIVGVSVAPRQPVARAVLLTAVAAVLVGETLLVSVNRWSQGRYNAAIWPLFAILIVLGYEKLSKCLRWRWLRVVTLAALALAMLVRVDAYHRLGRPHWDRMAAAVAQAQRPGEPVLAQNDWSKVTLEHYLDQPVSSLRNSAAELRAAVASSPSALLVVRVGGRPVPRLARRGVLIARIPQTGELYRLTPQSLGLGPASAGDQWPQPSSALVAADLELAPRGCLARLLGETPLEEPVTRPWSRLELDGSSDPFLRAGWSRVESAANGASSRWVTGREASAVALWPAGTAARLSLRLWPAEGLKGQEMRLLAGSCDLGAAPLPQGPQTVRFDAPAPCWQDGRSLVVLQLREVVDPESDQGLPRAAAVDWIEITPASPATLRP